MESPRDRHTDNLTVTQDRGKVQKLYIWNLKKKKSHIGLFVIVGALVSLPKKEHSVATQHSYWFSLQWPWANQKLIYAKKGNIWEIFPSKVIKILKVWAFNRERLDNSSK